MHDLLTAYSLVHPHIRFAIKNVPETASAKARGSGTGAAGDWVKPAVDGTVEAVRSLFGGEVAGTVEWWVEEEEEREEREELEEDEDEKEEENKRVRIESILARVDASEFSLFNLSKSVALFCGIDLIPLSCGLQILPLRAAEIAYLFTSTTGRYRIAGGR